MDVPEAAVADRGACGCVPVSDKWVSRAHLCLECACYRETDQVRRHVHMHCVWGSAVQIFIGGFDRTFFLVIRVCLLRHICITL
jgi:hypothetical protein